MENSPTDKVQQRDETPIEETFINEGSNTSSDEDTESLTKQVQEKDYDDNQTEQKGNSTLFSWIQQNQLKCELINAIFFPSYCIVMSFCESISPLAISYYGFGLFILFVIHMFAILSSLGQSLPKAQKQPPPLKMRIVSYIFTAYSSISLIMIALGEIFDTMIAQQTIQDVPQIEQYLQFMTIMLPKWRDFGTSMSLIITFIIAIMQNKVIDKINEANMKDDSSDFEFYDFDIAEEQNRKEYCFKRKSIIIIEILLFCFIASLSSKELLTLIPYTLVFCIQILIIQHSGSKIIALSKISKIVGTFIIAFIFCDISAQYIIEIRQENKSIEFLKNIGISLSLSSTQNILKLMLLSIQFMKISFTHMSYLEHKNKLDSMKIKDNNSILNSVQNVIAFSAIAIIYTIIYPSVLLLLLMPFSLGGFFFQNIDQPPKWYHIYSRVMVVYIIYSQFLIKIFDEVIHLLYALQFNFNPEALMILQQLSKVIGTSILEIFKSEIIQTNNTSLAFTILLGLSFFGGKNLVGVKQNAQTYKLKSCKNISDKICSKFSIYNLKQQTKNGMMFTLIEVQKRFGIFAQEQQGIISLIIVLISVSYKQSILSLVGIPLIITTKLRIKFIIHYLSYCVLQQFTVTYLQQYGITILGQWKNHFTFLFCDTYECQIDWEYWLSLGQINETCIMVDFILILLSVILQQCQNNIVQDDDQRKFYIEEIVRQKNIKGKIASFIFNEFRQIFVFEIFIYVLSNTKKIDLISSVYLFFALYFFLNFAKFESRKSQNFIQPFRVYFIFHLTTMLVFQSPLFGCPFFQTLNKSKEYINHQQCASIQEDQQDNYQIGQYEENDSQALTIYKLLINSIGLYKIEKGKISWSLIFLIIISEAQQIILNHPYYQETKIAHLKKQNSIDQYVRVIKYIEYIHFQKLWRFKAIKEEIKILHSRLIRITESIKNSVHSNHLLWDFDEEDYNPNDQRQSLVSEVSSGYEVFENERKTFFDPDLNDNLPQELQSKIDKHFKQLFEFHRGNIENLALDQLNKDRTPIVPLKLFNAAFENLLINKFVSKYQQIQSNIDDIDIMNFIRIDQRSIEEYLLDIGLKLQKQVEIKAQIDLYYQKNIGLKFISEKGYDQILLREGQYALFTKLLDLETLENKSQNLYAIEQETLQLYPQLGWKRYNAKIREFLWENWIDQTLFITLNPPEKIYSIYDIDMTVLLGNVILSQSLNLSYASFFLNFILNGDILSMMLPISVLIYSFLIVPIPTKGFWKLVQSYQLLVVLLKFFYQFPLFCSTPEFTIYSQDKCNYSKVPSEALIKRLDYIIGIHKYQGPASYPKDQGVLIGILPDLVVLFMVLNVKIYLTKTGKWNHMIIKKSIYDTPSFKCPERFMTSANLQKIQAKKIALNIQYTSLNWRSKLYYQLKRKLMHLQQLIFRILPVYMENIQKNRDIRTLEDEPLQVLNVKKVKPGKDYFNQSFFSLLLIFSYNLFFFRSWTGQTHASALSSANLQRFSVSQVVVLFFILVLMMIERMLYRVRQTQNERPNSLSKHSLAIKLAIHVVLVLIVHIDIGLVVPKHNNITYEKKFPLVIMYLLWLYYFIQSALQIKYGYPQAPFKAPFIRDTSLITVWAFRIYKSMPFLWEMKVIIDWTVTSTCLDLFQWFKLDDAFNYLYQCQVQNNDRQQRREFSQRPLWEKFFQGFCFAFALILIILAPILLFSGINPIMVNNPVLSGELQISLSLNDNGSQYDLLRTQAYHIQGLNQTDIDGLQEHYAEGSVKFESPKMQKMYFSPYSEYAWQISPPSLQKFIKDFNDLKEQDYAFFDIKAKWLLKRDNPIGNEQATQQLSVRKGIQMLQPIIDALSDHQQEGNQTIINHKDSTILVENLLPKFLKLGDSQIAQPLDVIPLMSNLSTFASAKLSLNHGQQSGSDFSNSQLYWTYEVLASDRDGIFKSSIAQDDHNLVLIVYNEQVIGSLFGTALQLSVVGLYATIVIAIGRFLRLAFDRISQRVIYEEMDPETTEQLFEICEGIYIAQLEGDLIKEKRLYDLLIRLYRSPETLIKINRQAKQELEQERMKNE